MQIYKYRDLDLVCRGDVDWRHGRAPFYIWYGGDDVFDVAKKAYTMFMQENGGGTKTREIFEF